ncbi:DUF3857 domain-containing protein [Polluticoccus soli]|uniref:DUF3857 domain-containing protein n=1 Tax=Polluticoccus soli TaxID=3034150 RepID=UPI0023E30443|nr:DUF3857 domain-containing protein [Flavipsychrobacter sp. JY13-12]
MKRLLLSLATQCLISASASAQYNLPVTWEARPKLHRIPNELMNESGVFILDSRHIEYRQENNNTFVYRTMHRIIKVLDDKGIENFNKIEIPIGHNEIERIQARTILADGTVKEVQQDKIKRSKNEQGQDSYIFAMEGVEKNAEVELMYREKKDFAVFGGEQLQFGIPTVKAEFMLVVPEGVRFETKGYNGFPSTKDSIIGGKHFYYATTSNIPALDEEQYSNREAFLMNIAYRMSYMDKENPDVKLFTWNDLAKRLYNNYYQITDKDKKVIGKYLTSIGVSDQDDDEQKIRKIEDAMKSNINMSDDINDESYLKFDKIVDKKLTTESGFTAFFLACLQVANIAHEYGLTSNRFLNPLDDKFENWNPLDISIVYFPKLKKYLSVNGIFYRMPFIPTAAAGNKGVFLKTTTLGGMTSAIASVRKIPFMPIEASNHNIEADIKFGVEMTPQVDIKMVYEGYSANGIREGFIYVPKDKEKELVQSLVSVASKPEYIKSYKVENAAFNNYYDNKPLNVIATAEAPQLMEKAGPKYLFKLGDVIGRQVEMYQEKERKLPIDMAFPHTLYRTITLNIPDGYKVSNPETIKMMVEHKAISGEQTMAFISDYKMDGKKMRITVKEFYSQVNYPVSDIEIFKKVINAAADFNKVVLVLEKG